MMLRPRPTKWDFRVYLECAKWEGTPYRLNRSVVGAGVDCLHFAASVLDQLYGSQHSRDLNSLPPDACIHNRKGVISAARALFTKYPAVKRVRDGSVEAGDLVIFGRAAALDSTQHLTVAGLPGTLWTASIPTVRMTGLVPPAELRLVCVYRASDKEKWHASI